MRHMRDIHPLGHMLFLTKKWSYPAYPAKRPCVFSWLDFRITLGFLFKLKSTVKGQKFSSIEIVPKCMPCYLKATPQKETRTILSVDSLSRERRGVWEWACVCCPLSSSIRVLKVLILNPGYSSQSPGKL